MTAANNAPKEAAQSAVAMVPLFRRIGLILVFLWFLFGGVAHFSLTEVECASCRPPFRGREPRC